MYNSQNLPLEKRKIVKKSLGAMFSSVLISLFVSIMLWVTLYSLGYGIASIMYALLVFIVINVLFGGSAVLYQYLYYKYYYYNFEDDKAEIKKGVVSNATGHVRYERIQNIYIDQDMLDRIFSLYDVHYETAGETSGFYSHVDGLNKENADKLIDFLNSKVRGDSNYETKNLNNNPEVKLEDSAIIEDDRVFTRENIPVDQKIVTINFIRMAFLYLVIFGFFVGRIALDLSDFVGGAGWLIILLPIVAILLFSYAYAKIWYKNFYFKFDNNGGVISEQVISSSNKHLYYDRIQNIDVSQGVMERIFGLNKMVIETASEGTKLSALAIPGLKKENAEILRDFLLERSKRYRSI